MQYFITIYKLGSTFFIIILEMMYRNFPCNICKPFYLCRCKLNRKYIGVSSLIFFCRWLFQVWYISKYGILFYMLNIFLLYTFFVVLYNVLGCIKIDTNIFLVLGFVNHLMKVRDSKKLLKYWKNWFCWQFKKSKCIPRFRPKSGVPLDRYCSKFHLLSVPY